MRKIICFVMLLGLVGVSSVFAEVTISFKNGITLGGFGTMSPAVQGGGFDFGFGLFQKDAFYMRNHIEISSMALAVDAGAFAIREKLILGGHIDVTDNFAVRSYGIIELGFLMFAVGDGDTLDKNFEDAPFIIEPRLGTGIEFMFGNSSSSYRGSFFIEMLAGVQVLTSGKSLSEAYRGLEDSYVSFNIGGRWYI